MLIHPSVAAEEVGFKKSTFYTLMKTDPRLRACVVEIPGVRGKRIHREALARWIDQLRSEQHPAYA